MNAPPRPWPWGGWGLLLAVCVAGGAAAEVPWQEIKGRHFVVRHQGTEVFAREVARVADDEYGRISRGLGFARHDGFWVWDNRVPIDVYATRDDYRRATGAPAWSSGRADYASPRISSFVGSTNFVGSVLPHEIAHLIFREFIGADQPLPLWLDEGVAQWADPVAHAQGLRVSQALAARGRLLPLATLTRLDVRHGATGPQAAVFYAQAGSLVRYMIERHGASRFRQFCGHLRDGRVLEDALRFTYPHTIRSLEALESGWRAYLAEGAAS